MANAGNIDIKITVDNAKFKAEMKKSADETKNFAATANKAIKQHERDWKASVKAKANASKQAANAVKAAAKKESDSLKKAAAAAKSLAREQKRTIVVTKSFGKEMSTLAKKALLAVASFRVASTVVRGVVTEFEKLKRTSRDISVWSDALGIGTTELQEFGMAAEFVGFSAKKTADILKDVSDKMGDFLSTGGGEAKDIFKSLNIGAEQFKNLSPDKALLKMVAAIDRFKGTSKELSKKEEVFLLEAIANDASKLLPLLRDNGIEMDKIIKLGKSSGRIMSPEELKDMERLNKATDKLGHAWEGLKKTISLALVDPIINSIKHMGDLIKKAKEYASSLKSGRGGKKMNDAETNQLLKGKENLNFWDRWLLKIDEMQQALNKNTYMLEKKMPGNNTRAFGEKVDPIGGPSHLQSDPRTQKQLAAAANSRSSIPGVDFSKAEDKKADMFSMANVLAQTGITMKDGAFVFKGAATDMGASSALFKDAVTKFQKGRKPIGDILKARGAGGSQRVLEKFAPEQAQSDKFDKTFNELVKKRESLGDEATAADFAGGLARLRDIMSGFSGEGSAKVGKATDQMAQMIKDIQGFVKKAPESPVVEVKVSLEKGLVAKFIKQNASVIGTIAEERLIAATSAGSSTIGK